MVRSRRSFAWSLILALLCASFVGAQGTPVARAAGLTCPSGESCIVVTSAADPFNDTLPPNPGASPDYKCDATTTDGCTLREAITLANQAAAGVKTRIQFSIPRNGIGWASQMFRGETVETWTITLIAPLPAIDHDNTIVDGFSQEQFTNGTSNNFGPTIAIDGGPLTNGTAAFPPQGTGGLLVRSSNNLIQGLSIINFKTSGTGGSTLLGIGIEIARNTGVNPANNATGNTVRGCYLGVDEIGQNAAPNSYGLWVQTDNNTIGGNNALSSQDPNIISGNFNDGILLTGGTNLVRGNYIGLNREGNLAIGNHESGVNMRTSGGNIIGTPSNPLDSTFGNIISGNGQNGVFISNGSNNTINGNLIGTNATGGAAIGNGVDGVRIESSTSLTSNNKIGEKDFFNRNIISGNGNAGVHLAGFNTKANVILNNFIGPSAGGIGLTGSSNRNGIIIDNGSDGNTIGGALLGDFLSLAADNEANVISGNLSDGVVISGTVSQDNKLIGNTIGLDESRGFSFGNGGRGVVIMNGPQTAVIGGAGSLGNVISANNGAGIYIVGATAPVTDVLILGNTIGLRRNTTAPFNASSPINSPAGNNGDGIFINHADKVHIGGTVAEANLISKNTGNGIISTNTNLTIIQNNMIGTLKNGSQFTNLGNTGTGIRVTGTVTATGNFVLYNGVNGFWITGGAKSPLTTNTVNFNIGHGFLVDGAAADIQITGSTIYSNTLNGVFVGGSAQKVRIIDNSMTGNAVNAPTFNKKGIVLNSSTLWPALGSVTTPNHDIDPPYALHMDQTGKVSGSIRLKADNPAVEACAQPCTIQVFTPNPQTLDTQGRDKINVTPTITPDSKDPTFGNFSVAIGAVPAQLVLTATDKDGNTSEFAVFTRTFGLDIQPPRTFGPAFPGDVITYTHRITNTGSVDFTNIQFTGFSKLGWPFTLAPASPIALAAGESKPVTLTLTLPTGADPRVKFPNTEFTRLTVSATTNLVSPPVVTTASVTDTTILGAKFILDASFKEGRTGSAAQGTSIDYTRSLINTGNVTGTVTLNAVTDLGWTTLITPTVVTIAPGASVGVVSSVAVPKGTTAGTIGKTTLTFTGTPDAQQLVITDTTTTLLTPLATMVAPQVRDGGASETVQFCHTVTNLSNGVATFTLTGVSSLGSKITYISDTPGQQLVNGNTFTVSNTPGSNIFNFCAKVVVDVRALPGQHDLISIGMLDSNGNVVGGASVRDQINVVRSAMAPRLYLPLVRR